MNSLVIQYIVLGVLFIFACYSVFKILAKNFDPNKKSKNKKGCDRGCCS
jgi:hypothetical protein